MHKEQCTAPYLRPEVLARQDKRLMAHAITGVWGCRCQKLPANVPSAPLLAVLLQVPVDILGVVTEVGELASRKRKDNGQEVMKRELTLVDKR